MAAIAEVATVNISINGIDLAVPKGELVVESVKRLGLDIPIFCYHPRLKPVGMCRMCLVEIGFKQPDGTVRKMPKPQAACTLPSSEGLAIYTDTEAIHKDRKSVLEFLLINHPLDCPICDRGGECPLQNNTLFYGPSTSRYVEMKRHAPKAFPLSKYVTLDLERCIQCGRCVRFTEEISGDAQLAFRFRGGAMQPSTFELTDFDSKFSGNVIEICPVGALTSSEYRFRARPWDLQTKPAICTQCSNGCNIWFDYRVESMVRINGRTNEAVNEEWTCDKGKFGHEFYNSDDRLTKVLIRKGEQLQPTSWAEAFAEVGIAFQGHEGKSAALVGSTNSNEAMFVLKNLFDETFKSPFYDHRMTKDLSPLPNDAVKNSIASLEQAKVIFVAGTSLADDLPIIFLRVRKAWFQHGAKIVVAHEGPTDLDSFADSVLQVKPGELSSLLSALQGNGSASTLGIPADRLESVKQLLNTEGAVYVTSRGICNLNGGAKAVSELEKMAAANKATLNIYALGANDQGATELGLDGSNKNTAQILQGCVDGSIKALWLAGIDPLTSYPDGELARQALENVPFLVYQGHSFTEAAHYASIVLPEAAPMEGEGTYTSAERRVQHVRPILSPKGEAKAGWRIFSELAMRLSTAMPAFSASEVMNELSSKNKDFLGAKHDRLPAFGYLLGEPLTASEAILEPAIPLVQG